MFLSKKWILGRCNPGFEVLADALVGNPGAPLWKALTDSRLGEDVAPVTGLETEAGRAVFSVGLRGTEPARAAAIERLALDTLASLAEGGIDGRVVASAINRIEFRHREIRGNGSPYALRLLRRALRGWSYGADPVESLEFAPVMASFRRRLAGDGRLLERLVRDLLLENRHRATLVIRPDEGQAAREEADERARAAASERRMSPADRARHAAEQAAFAAFQSRVETPEELALIPVIGRAALRREPEAIPVGEERLADGAPVLVHDLFTNGIVYVDLCFGVRGLASAQVLLLPLLARAITGCGLPGEGYARTALELFRLTGGFTAALDAHATVDNPARAQAHLVFRVRALDAMLPEALALVAGLVASADFNEPGRLRDLAIELRNHFAAALVPGGARFAALRAGSRVSAVMALEERWHGVTQLEYLRELSGGLDGRLESLAADLEKLRGTLCTRGNVLFNVTGSAEGLGEAVRALEAVEAGLPAGGPGGPEAEAATVAAEAWMRAESLAAGTPVGYAARVVPAFPWADLRGPHTAVLGHLLTTGSLWEKIRREGGAYGVSAYPRPVEGLFVLASYRDPNIARTLGAFRGAFEHLSAAGPGEDEVERAVVGVVGGEDRPLDPGEKGYLSLRRRLAGITERDRLARRQAVLECTGSDLATAARGILDGWDRGSTAVLAGRPAIEEGARELPELAEAVREVPS